jgi:hypothetical protein
MSHFSERFNSLSMFVTRMTQQKEAEGTVEKLWETRGGFAN